MELPIKAGDMEKFVAVAAGSNHLIALTTHGNLFAWGDGGQGQLGRKIVQRRVIQGTVPTRVCLGHRSRKAVVIGAGDYTSFAVDDQGDVWGWGLDNRGQTGTGNSNPDRDLTLAGPKKVIGLSKRELNGESVVEIAGGVHHTLFLTSGGRVFAVGSSRNGLLGLPADHPVFANPKFPGRITTPVEVPFPNPDDPVRRIAVRERGNMAVTVGGALYAWGEGNAGQLGLGDENRTVETPTVVMGGVGEPFAVYDVSCGDQHTLALLRNRETKEL